MKDLEPDESLLNPTFQALADPTRRKILNILSKGNATVIELAKPFQMTLPAISKHLRVLEKAGLIERQKYAQFRPCQLNVKSLQIANLWLELKRMLWEERLNRLDSYLINLESTNKKTRKKVKKNS
ncbi:metalloregulator ArsR/SmtB family transcription factor [Leptospira ryugenii]|uniref:metalloregulator ArsR/SmtB family transcription factor n=1 Tax=Leptospira ryugenii TaxID=1917863 RepID=UPI003F76D466